MKTFKKVILALAVVAFLAAVPWAISYNLSYDRYGAIDRPAPPVFIRVATVGAGSLNNTLKAKAAEYSNRNGGVRIFVLALTQEQIGAQEFDIRIVRDGDEVHAFVSPVQVKEAIQHCEKFLEKIAQENENVKIHI